MRGVLLSLLGILMLLWGCGGDSKPPNGTDGDNETFSVVFITDPAGATVYFDGDSIGVTTDDPAHPLRLEGVAFGEPHAYRIRKQGYAAVVENNYNPASTGTKQVNVVLMQSATVRITTTPSGAYVVVSTQPAKQGISPLVLSDVRIGKYEVTVSKSGYMTLTDSLDLSVSLDRHFTLFEPPEVVGAIIRATNKGGTDIVTDELNRFPQALFDTGPQGLDRCSYMELVITIDRVLPDLAPLTIVPAFEGTDLAPQKVSIPAGETVSAFRFRHPNNPGPLEPYIWMVKGYYDVRVLIMGQIAWQMSFEIY